MKKIIYLFLSLVFLSIFVIVTFFYWYKNQTLAPSESEETVRIVVAKGASAETIGKTLESEKIIKNAFAFKLYIQSKSLTKKIPTGQFVLPKNLSLSQIVDLILEGPTQVWVTIPEGRRREEYPTFFINAFGLSGVDAKDFETEFLNLTQNLEGKLFPDTYLFPPDANSSMIVNSLTNTFKTKFEEKYLNEIDKSNLNLNQIISLASIIERETKNTSERKIVAGIYLKRLANDWPLQADATVQYIFGNENEWWPRPITQQMLDTKSSFNTYLNQGLPLSPIASPGLSALVAVVEPEDSPYWYYIHDTNGMIHYARDLSEHNANVQKYLR